MKHAFTTVGPQLLFGTLAAVPLAAAPLLLWLSSFGQNPFPELPAGLLLALGALFAGPLESLARGWARRRLGNALGLAAATNLVALALMNGTGMLAQHYLLAPATALALPLIFRMLPGRLGEMLSSMTVYVVATVLANYTFDSFLPLGDFFLVNVGTFFFGVTFTQRDRVHRFGRKAVYTMILVAAVANVVTASSLGTPLRYVFVAFLAIVLSETVDTEIYGRLLHRPWLVRVASSNAASAPLDTILFTVLAFAGEEFATLYWLVQVIVTDVLVKYAAGMLAALRILGRGANLPGLRSGTT